MPSFHVSWNERIFYESYFTTDAEEDSDAWYDALLENNAWVDSNGMDDIRVEVMHDDDNV